MSLGKETFAALIDACREETARSGIEVRRGKKYLTVALRVELARRALGDIGIETEIISAGRQKGDLVLVRAVIRDRDGRVLATGHAEEIRGGRGVNTTAPLENAETSAIGRALAALGANGGEFASADEVAGKVERTHGQSSSRQRAPAQATTTTKVSLADKGMEIKANLEAARTLADLDKVMAEEAKTLGEIQRQKPTWHSRIYEIYRRRRQELEMPDLARQAPVPPEFADAAPNEPPF